MKRAFAYGRFSSILQEDNTSMENQMKVCHSYADSHELEIVREYKDDAVSGTISMEKRPKGKEMIDALMRGEAESVIIYVPDRANRDTLNALLLRRFLKRKKIEIHFTNLGLIAGMNEFLATLLDMMAENELHSIMDRTHKGRFNKVIDQKKMVLANYPYGYIKIGIKKDAYLKIDSQKAEIIKMIFNMYVYDGYSLQGIADYLDSQDIPTRNGLRASESSNGHAWYQRTIHILLKQPLYKGTYVWGKTAFHEKEYDDQPFEDRRYKVAKNEWKILEFPELAIVSPKLWDLAQEKLNKNREFTRWTSKNHGKFLLSGFIRCSACGRAMGGVTNKYRTAKGELRERYSYKCHNRDCANYGTAIKQYILDNIIWDWLETQLQDERKLNEGLDLLYQKRKSEAENSEYKKEELLQLINETNSQIRNLTRSLARIDNDDVAKTVENEINMLMRQKVAAEKKLQTLDDMIKNENAIFEEKNQILKLARSIAKKMELGDKLSVMDRRKLLQLVDLKIIWVKGEVNNEEYRGIIVRWGLYKPESFLIEEREGSYEPDVHCVHVIINFEAQLPIDVTKTWPRKTNVYIQDDI